MQEREVFFRFSVKETGALCSLGADEVRKQGVRCDEIVEEDDGVSLDNRADMVLFC
jgi:hypothetical protein